MANPRLKSVLDDTAGPETLHPLTHVRITVPEPPRLGVQEVGLRFGLVVLGLVLWFATQWLIGLKGFPNAGIGDAVHTWTAGFHTYLLRHDAAANALLISSSALINILALVILGRAIFGPSLRPFVGLVIVFALRQVMQALTALPPPTEMIWHDPGFPGGLVTYGVSNDLFFSGHTAIAVYGAIELARLRGWYWKPIGLAIAVFEIMAVLLLRAHYTMDVYAGIVTALWVAGMMEWLGPKVDGLVKRLSGAAGAPAS